MPAHYSKKELNQLLKLVHSHSLLNLRMKAAAEAFLNKPYVADSLIGGPEEREVFTFDLQGFDCVTFVESVLSLARASSVSSFLSQLRHIRYKKGEVTWRKRLHYFSDWLKANKTAGVIRPITHKGRSKKIQTRLAVISNLRPRMVTIDVVPKSKWSSLKHEIVDGTIASFASLSKDLDYFHTGLLFWDHELMLYHASRSRGKVVREPLQDFLKRNRMRGITLAVPCSTSTKLKSRRNEP